MNIKRTPRISAAAFRLGYVERAERDDGIDAQLDWRHCAYIVCVTGRGCVWSGRTLADGRRAMMQALAKAGAR